MRKLPLFIVGLLAVCLLVSLLSMAQSGPSAVIDIDGNDALRQMALDEGWSGRGTSWDLYVIKGPDISSEGKMGSRSATPTCTSA